MYVFRREHEPRLKLPAEADFQTIEAVDHITQALVLSGKEARLKGNIQLDTEPYQANVPAKMIPTYMRIPHKGLNEKKIRITECIGMRNGSSICRKRG